LSRDPRHDVAASGVLFIDFRLHPDLVETARDILCGLAFPGAGVVAVVGGVELDELTAQVDDLDLRRAQVPVCLRHLTLPSAAAPLSRPCHGHPPTENWFGLPQTFAMVKSVRRCECWMTKSGWRNR